MVMSFQFLHGNPFFDCTTKCTIQHGNPESRTTEDLAREALPEPHAWQHEDGSSSFISNRVKTTVPASGKWPAYYSAPLYTADQMREYAALVRAEALEKAARVAEEAHASLVQQGLALRNNVLKGQP